MRTPVVAVACALLCVTGSVVGGTAASAAPAASPSPGCTTGRSGTAPVPAPRDRPLQIVHVPDGYSGDRPVPLILAFHGAGRTPQDMETYSDLDRADAVVAYPDGRYTKADGTEGRGWPPTDAEPDRTPDLDYVARLVESLRNTLCIDTGRVYATGKSQGGGFTYLLACKGDGRGHPLVSAIAPVAGAFYRPGPVHHGVASCDPTPRNVLEIHGDADGTIDYRGRDDHGHQGRARAVRTVGDDEGWVDEWVRRDRCAAEEPPAAEPPAGSTVDRWRHCADGTTVTHYRISGGDHNWPGSNGPSGPGNQCVSDVRATQVVLGFFGVPATAEPRRTCGSTPA